MANRPHPSRRLIGSAGALALALMAGAVASGADAPTRFSLQPLEFNAGVESVPPLADMRDDPTARELQARAKAKDYERELKALRFRCFGNKRNGDLRAEGIRELREFKDPAAFLPMVEVLRDEQDDVRLALLDHFLDQGEWGQAALAWIALHEMDPAFNYEAIKRLQAPVSPPTLNVIDAGLRSEDDFVVNLAGRLAGQLDIFDAIPLLIHGQASERRVQQTGDEAWIAVGTQRVFIRALIPIIGDNSGAYLPVPGVLTDGVLLRVMEAVAMIYRTEVHRTLVAMTTRDWGRSTAQLGYDKERWTAWYNDEYLPFKREQARIRDLAEKKHDKLPG